MSLRAILCQVVISSAFATTGSLMPHFMILVGAEPEHHEEAVLVRGLAAGWRQNREAFNRFSCRYRLTRGKAATREDALAGRLADVFVAHGVWAVDGEAERCSLETNDDAVPKNVTEKPDGTAFMSAPISSRFFVTNGPIKLFGGSVIGAATLYGAAWGEQTNDVTTPFDMGVMGPGETATPAVLVERHVNTGGRYEIREGIGIDGGEAVSAVLIDESGDTISYTFDPQRGFLTSRIAKQRRYATEVHVTAAEQSRDGFWFPMRSVRLDLPQKLGLPISVQVIEVTKLDFSPEPRDFMITLPKGTTLVDRSDAYSQHRLEKSLEVSPASLPDVEVRCRDIAEMRKATRGLAKGSPPPRASNWWLIIGSTMVSAVVGWILLRRFRRSDRWG